jgi:hypothetical protein
VVARLGHGWELRSQIPLAAGSMPAWSASSRGGSSLSRSIVAVGRTPSGTGRGLPLVFNTGSHSQHPVSDSAPAN